MKSFLLFSIISLPLFSMVVSVSKTFENPDKDILSKVSSGEKNSHVEQINYIQKGIKVGNKGLKINVALPIVPLKSKGGKYPKGYWKSEEKIARKVNNWMKSGKYSDKNEAIRIAHEQIKQKFKKDTKERKKEVHRKKPIGYHSRTSWTFRRIVGILQADNNQISDLPQARIQADKEYEEKVARAREKRLKKLQESRNDHTATSF